MTPQLGYYIATYVLGLAFIAGGAWFREKQTRRDLNGLGKKFRGLVSLLVRWADDDEKREQLARFLEGK